MATQKYDPVNDERAFKKYEGYAWGESCLYVSFSEPKEIERNPPIPPNSIFVRVNGSDAAWMFRWGSSMILDQTNEIERSLISAAMERDCLIFAEQLEIQNPCAEASGARIAAKDWRKWGNALVR